MFDKSFFIVHYIDSLTEAERKLHDQFLLYQTVKLVEINYWPMLSQ